MIFFAYILFIPLWEFKLKLLLDRGQKSYNPISILPLRFGSGVVFTIKAQLELEPHELELIDKYKLRKAVIADSSFWDDLKRAIPQGFLVALIGSLLFLIFSTLYNAGSAFAAIFLIMTIVYYKEEKERIVVSDFIKRDRTFRCDTVVDLVHKEKALAQHFQYLQHLLVTSKHWDDREAIDIHPLENIDAKHGIILARP